MAPGILNAHGKYAAGAAAATHAASALSEPLLSNKQSGLTDNSWDDEDTSLQSENHVPGMSRKDIASTIAASLLATGGLAAAASAMIAVPSAAVFLMGGICAFNSPTVAHKQLSISKSEGVRASVNHIRKEIEVLKDQVDFLTQSADDLEEEADVLIGLEQDLRKIATKQGKNVNELVDLVAENESILNKMKGNLKQTFVASMAKIVLRSDKDGDMKIDDKEIPLLALRLEIQLQPYGIKLDTAAFEDMIREDNDISNVLKFCGDVLFKGESDDNDDSDSVDSEVTCDFESFCKSLNDEPENYSYKMTYDEKMNMVTVDDKICKGSVESARGKRMTLMPNKKKKDTRKKTIVKEAKKRKTKMADRPTKPVAKVSARPMERIDSADSFNSGMILRRGSQAEF